MSNSEIRDSLKNKLLEKVRKHDYGSYLFKINAQRIRGFFGEEITFEFPVTALIGPNGSGKSALLGAAGCAYKTFRPSSFFPKSTVGDSSMSGWKLEYDIIDKKVNNRHVVRRSASFRQARWVRDDVLERYVEFFGIERTVPAGEKKSFKELTRSTYIHNQPLAPLD